MVTSESAVILSLSRKALNNLLGRRDDSAGAALGLTPEDASFATSALKKSPALGGLRQAHHKMLAGVSASLLACLPFLHSPCVCLGNQCLPARPFGLPPMHAQVNTVIVQMRSKVNCISKPTLILMLISCIYRMQTNDSSLPLIIPERLTENEGPLLGKQSAPTRHFSVSQSAESQCLLPGLLRPL